MGIKKLSWPETDLINVFVFISSSAIKLDIDKVRIITKTSYDMKLYFLCSELIDIFL
jgi:hypothetical protein